MSADASHPTRAVRHGIRLRPPNLHERMMDCVGQWPPVEIDASNRQRLHRLATSLLAEWSAAGCPPEGADAAAVLLSWPAGPIRTARNHAAHTAFAREVYDRWIEERREAVRPMYERPDGARLIAVARKRENAVG